MQPAAASDGEPERVQMRQLAPAGDGDLLENAIGVIAGAALLGQIPDLTLPLDGATPPQR